jgi:hypothetical protein
MVEPERVVLRWSDHLCNFALHDEEVRVVDVQLN